MHLETVDKFTDLAAKKVKYQKKSPSGFFVGAMMAGARVDQTISVMGNGDQTAKATSDIMGLPIGLHPSRPPQKQRNRAMPRERQPR